MEDLKLIISILEKYGVFSVCTEHDEIHFSPRSNITYSQGDLAVLNAVASVDEDNNVMMFT